MFQDCWLVLIVVLGLYVVCLLILEFGDLGRSFDVWFVVGGFTGFGSRWIRLTGE